MGTGTHEFDNHPTTDLDEAAARADYDAYRAWQDGEGGCAAMAKAWETDSSPTPELLARAAFMAGRRSVVYTETLGEA